MSLQNTSSDLVCKIMDYMNISELNITSKVCKSLKHDSELYAVKIKKEKNLKSLNDKHTCKNCLLTDYKVDKQFCTHCVTHMCHNCFGVRNSMDDFFKYGTKNNQDVYEFKLMCRGYCIYRCHKCKFVDSRHELFLNDNSELQTICIDCFVSLNEEEKKKYDSVHNNDDNDDWDLDELD